MYAYFVNIKSEITKEFKVYGKLRGICLSQERTVLPHSIQQIYQVSVQSLRHKMTASHLFATFLPKIFFP